MMSQILRFEKKVSNASRQDLFQARVKPIVRLLFRKSYEYCGTKESAEDLLQEVLTELFVNYDGFMQAQNPKGFALKCLYFRFVDGYRKQKRQPTTVEFEENSEDIKGSDRQGPQAALMSSKILDSLDILNPTQRAAVIMHDIEGYTLEELQNLLGIPVGTLKSHLHRARKKLKQHINMQPFDLIRRCKD